MTNHQSSGTEQCWIGDSAIARRVIDHIHAMTGYWTSDLVCRFANAAYSDWFGKTPEQMLGIHMPDALGPIFQLNWPHIQAVLAGEARTFERKVVVANGTLRHSLMTYTPDIVDGRVQGFFVHVADVTPLKHTEQALQQATGLLQGLGEAGRAIAASLDPATICATLYEHAQRWLPLDAMAVYWYTAGSISLTPLALWDEATQASALRALQPEAVLTWLTLQPDRLATMPGTGVMAAMLCQGDADQPRGLLLARMRNSNPRIESTVRTLAAHVATALSNADAYARLRDAQQELIEQAKMTALVRLVAGMAHELNTPISNILLTASSLAERTSQYRLAAANSAPTMAGLQRWLGDTAEGLVLIERAATVAAALVNSFKQVAPDRRADERRAIRLYELAESCIAAHQLSARQLGVRLEAAVAPDMVMETYPAILAQVLDQLLDNSLLHGFTGQPDGWIRVAACQHQSGHVLLTVEDNGNGMASDILARIFDPFFTTKMSTGKGLGMSMCFNQVRTLLGGQIRITSQVGQGTLVTLDLPGGVAPGQP